MDPEGAGGDVSSIDPWGLAVPPRKTVTRAVHSSDEEFEIAHVTQCALGDKPVDGAHVVKMRVAGQEYVLGTLGKGIAYQFPCDFGFSSSVEFTNLGPSTVYLSGYRTRCSRLEEYSDDGELGGGGYSDDEDEDDDEYDEDESESDDDDEPPRAIPIANGKVCRVWLCVCGVCVCVRVCPQNGSKRRAARRAHTHTNTTAATTPIYSLASACRRWRRATTTTTRTRTARTTRTRRARTVRLLVFLLIVVDLERQQQQGRRRQKALVRGLCAPNNTTCTHAPSLPLWQARRRRASRAAPSPLATTTWSARSCRVRVVLCVMLGVCLPWWR